MINLGKCLEYGTKFLFVFIVIQYVIYFYHKLNYLMQCSCNNYGPSTSSSTPTSMPTTRTPFVEQFDIVEDEYTTTKSLEPLTTTTIPECSTSITEKRYITTYSYNGRFGNLIFRCASLYGIGKALNRFPYHSEVTTKQVGQLTEFSEVFPLMSDYIEIKLPPKGSEKVVKYARDACKYDPPSNLNPYNSSKFIRMWGVYLQSWKYFEDYKTDIRKLLECSPVLRQKAKVEAPIMWKTDNSSHKFCVHIRLGDFKSYRTFLETRADFLVPAIKYINNQIKAKTKQNTSLLIFGDDYNFIKSLKFPNMFTSINTFGNIKGSSRGFEMCFAIEFCDTFLISASSSSFGWWIGYLLKSQGTVYYNAEIAKLKTFTKYMYAEDAFPPHWKKLNVSSKGDVKEV